MTEHSRYPRRETHFAYKVVRMMAKTCAAQTMGPEACWLVSIIATLEDTKRYKEPVTFYNEQLMPLCAVNSKSTFIRIRKRAAESGWLHYEAGGKSTPGRYWALIPDRYQDLPDTSCDEGTLGCQNRNLKNGSVSELTRERDDKWNENGTTSGTLSYPSPLPFPNGPDRRGGANEPDRADFEEFCQKIPELADAAKRKVEPLPAGALSRGAFIPVKEPHLASTAMMVSWHRRQLSSPQPVTGDTEAHQILVVAAGICAMKTPLTKIKKNRVALFLHTVRTANWLPVLRWVDDAMDKLAELEPEKKGIKNDTEKV